MTVDIVIIIYYMTVVHINNKGCFDTIPTLEHAVFLLQGNCNVIVVIITLLWRRDK